MNPLESLTPVSDDDETSLTPVSDDDETSLTPVSDDEETFMTPLQSLTPVSDDEETLEIFCSYAFGHSDPDDGFEDVADEVTYRVGRIPMGLAIMGSYFRGMTELEEWEELLPKIRDSINKDELESVLRFSFDALAEEHKDLFLHIACIFNSEEVEKLEAHLEHKFDVDQGLKVLTKKSLISISNFFDRSAVFMNRLLVNMGRKIVFERFISEPLQRQFLVKSNDIYELLTHHDARGSRNVEGINFLSEIKEKITIRKRAFEGMSNLQFLKIIRCQTLDFPDGFDFVSRELRLLRCDFFPMTCFPSNVNFELLVQLDMWDSKLEKLWDGNKPISNLKWINLMSSKDLKKLPDLSTATNLQKLELRDCSSLVELPPTIGSAINLKLLDLYGCSSLSTLPKQIGKATSLKKLFCSSLLKLPITIQNLPELEFVKY